MTNISTPCVHLRWMNEKRKTETEFKQNEKKNA